MKLSFSFTRHHLITHNYLSNFTISSVDIDRIICDQTLITFTDVKAQIKPTHSNDSLVHNYLLFCVQIFRLAIHCSCSIESQFLSEQVGNLVPRTQSDGRRPGG